MNREEDIKLIMKHTTEDILRAMLDQLWTVNNNTFIGALRYRLSPQWYDGIWKPSTYMDTVITKLFTYRRTESRHFNGGSWSPECDYDMELYTCNLCGDIVDEDDKEKHIRNDCVSSKYIMNESNSLSEFKRVLLEEGSS